MTYNIKTFYSSYISSTSLLLMPYICLQKEYSTTTEAVLSTESR